jgi:hypothetical protein
MNIIPRYLFNNRTTVVANEAGFATENVSVYKRNLSIYKGIDNTLEFQLKNADSKPMSLANKEIKFAAFDEGKSQVLDLLGETVISNKGVFKVVIPANELDNIKQQYLTYVIYTIEDNERQLTYADEQSNATGTLYVSASAFPGPVATKNPGDFSLKDDMYVTQALRADPGLNGNDALHTAVIYTDSFNGTVTIQGTLDNSIEDSSAVSWADISTVTLTGSETEPTPVNFNGVYSYIRFKASSDPTNQITKILVRN